MKKRAMNWLLCLLGILPLPRLLLPGPTKNCRRRPKPQNLR